MKSLNYVISFIAAFFCIFTSNAQSKFHLTLDYRYMLGLSENGGAGDISRKDIDLYGNSLRLSGMYSFLPQFSAGIRIGADRYENPGYNTFPIFAAFQYNVPYSKIPLYLFGDAGYSLKTDSAAPGLLIDAGIGYKLMLKEHFGLNFQLGYNLKQFKEVYSGETSFSVQTRNSLTFGIGLVF